MVNTEKGELYTKRQLAFFVILHYMKAAIFILSLFIATATHAQNNKKQKDTTGKTGTVVKKNPKHCGKQ
jgi:hypothetical protein